MALVMGDHAGTHVDAPKHFNADPKAKSIDEVPLENFFTEAVCLDLSHKALKSDISIDDLEKAEQAAASPSNRRTPRCSTWISFAALTARWDSSPTFPG
jgi:kynurenine formamidase